MSLPAVSGCRYPAVVLIALAVVMGACAGSPDGTSSPIPSDRSESGAPSATTSPSDSDAGLPFQPARPFDGAAILAAMRDSRRPGGVPDVLETEPIASAIAASIWTIDGAAWDDLAAGGSCGPGSCTVEMVGVRDDADGEDLWTFSVDQASGSVVVVEALAGAVPHAVSSALDQRARSLLPARQLEGLILAAARWTPPPDASAYELAYRTGDEEGSCEIDVRLSADGGRVEDVTSTAC